MFVVIESRAVNVAPEVGAAVDVVFVLVVLSCVNVTAKLLALTELATEDI